MIEINQGDDVPDDWQAADWTERDIAFANEYLRTRKGAESYRRVFEVDRSDPREWALAAHRSQNLLAKPHIAGYVAAMTEAIRERLVVTRETITAELAKLAFANKTDYYRLQGDGTPQIDLSAITHEQAAAIQELTVQTFMEGRGEDAREVRDVRIKLADKTRALELLGKAEKMFTDVVETTTLSDIEREIREARFRRGKVKGEDDAQGDERQSESGAVGNDGREGEPDDV